LAKQRPAQIGFLVNMNSRTRFNVLRQEFGEDYLLGKEFGPDGQVRWFVAAARNNETER
jgi:hypothetical protein